MVSIEKAWNLIFLAKKKKKRKEKQRKA